MSNKVKMQSKVGLITVSLNGERVDLAEKCAISAYENLRKKGVDILQVEKIAMTSEDVLTAVKELQKEGVDCIIYLIGTWIFPPSVVTAICEITIPSIIWAVPEPATFSLVGAHVIHGSLDEMGIKHKLIYGDPNEEKTLDDIIAYSRAATVVNNLNGSRFGLIGGLSIGAYTFVADLVQVKSLFGIETKHIDQLVLIDKARKIPDEECEELRSFINTKFGKIYAPKEVMIRAIKLYKALRETIEEEKLDFVNVKCLEEVIKTYGSCCLAIALTNDDGVVTACQGDINGTIMMQILNLLTGEPVLFADVVTIDKLNKVIRMANCGFAATRLAKNPKEVDWGYQYEYMGKSRGVTTVFCCKPGKVTLAALSRIKGKYVMHITTGEAFEQPKEKLSEIRDVWPQAFIKMDGDVDKFIQNVRTGHTLMGYGNLKDELVAFCDILGITPIIS